MSPVDTHKAAAHRTPACCSCKPADCVSLGSTMQVGSSAPADGCRHDSVQCFMSLLAAMLGISEVPAEKWPNALVRDAANDGMRQTCGSWLVYCNEPVNRSADHGTVVGWVAGKSVFRAGQPEASLVRHCKVSLVGQLPSFQRSAGLRSCQCHSSERGCAECMPARAGTATRIMFWYRLSAYAWLRPSWYVHHC
nr:hypothetical protein CFP56_20312 [Quercus suber]